MSTIDETPIDDTTPDPDRPSGMTRRWALRAGGVGAIAAVVAACSGDDDDDDGGTDGSTDGGTDGGTDGNEDASGDLAVAQLAASLEVLAVGTYDKALQAATSGALGEVPPAVAEFVTVAKAQHQEHLDAWNGVITGAGETAVSEPPADLAATVETEFGKVTDVVGAARLALLLEETAAATYLGALTALKGADARTTAGKLICIDRQHAAILNFVLGEYPVPDTFATTDMAYSA